MNPIIETPHIVARPGAGRKIAFAVSGLILIAAGLLVPLPLLAVRAGPALDVPPRLTIGSTTHPVSGKLLLTTVQIEEPSAFGFVRAVFSRNEEIRRQEQVLPPGVSERDFLNAQFQAFTESSQVAAAVALRAAGQPVTLTGGGVQVVGVVKGGPAENKLRSGDVITAVDGLTVRLATDLVAATEQLPAGRVITLAIRRGSETSRVAIKLERVSELGRPGVGVLIQTLNPKVELPFTVSVSHDDIGGPSAGLMMSLSIYDLLTEADIARGRIIAGTGTIEIGGTVGPVGGIAEKVAGARRAGATIFLSPASEAAEARAAAGKGLRVISVGTFQDALRALASG